MKQNALPRQQPDEGHHLTAPDVDTIPMRINAERDTREIQTHTKDPEAAAHLSCENTVLKAVCEFSNLTDYDSRRVLEILSSGAPDVSSKLHEIPELSNQLIDLLCFVYAV